MRYDQAQSMVVFEGDVHAIREEMDIRARTVTVHLKKTAEGETAAAENDIEKIVAEGDVRITQGDRTGSSSRATYYADRGLLVMKGDPVLQEGKNRISGRVVRLYLRENRSEIEGGGDKRVEALFFTPRDIEGGDQEKQ
jgi:lipopolysaccharide export system protein LptA